MENKGSKKSSKAVGKAIVFFIISCLIFVGGIGLGVAVTSQLGKDEEHSTIESSSSELDTPHSSAEQETSEEESSTEKESTTEEETTTQEETTTEKETISVEEIKFEKQYSNDGYEYGIVTAYNKNKETVWTYQTPFFMDTELEQVYEIGRKEERYYLLQNGSVVSLDVSNGAIVWESEDSCGSGGNAILGEKAIYLTGYYGPDFTVVSYEGQIVHQIDSFNSNYYWAYKIELKENESIALVYMGGGAGVDIIFEVNLDTWEYEQKSIM